MKTLLILTLMVATFMGQVSAQTDNPKAYAKWPAKLSADQRQRALAEVAKNAPDKLSFAEADDDFLEHLRGLYWDREEEQAERAKLHGEMEQRFRAGQWKIEDSLPRKVQVAATPRLKTLLGREPEARELLELKGLLHLSGLAPQGAKSGHIEMQAAMLLHQFPKLTREQLNQFLAGKEADWLVITPTNWSDTQPPRPLPPLTPPAAGPTLVPKPGK